ncbi:MAG: TrkH family potassium uptake protein [Candidatus Methanomethylicia archaeon]
MARSILLHHTLTPALGVVFMIVSFTLIVPGILGFAFTLSGKHDEANIATAFIHIGLVSFALGFFTFRKFRIESVRLSYGEAIQIAVISWILIPIVNGVAISISGLMSPIDALFESISGFTTTGLTVLKPPIESQPLTLLFWRSVSQWVGGLGIIYISILVIAPPSLLTMRIFTVEGHLEKVEASAVETAHKIIRVYLLLTGLSIILFLIVGMNPFDALNHALTAIATGGFSTRTESIGYYKSIQVYIAAIILIILGALNFPSYTKLMKGKIRDFIKYEENKTFLALAFSISILLTSILASKSSIENPIMFGIFHTVSAIGGCGFQIGNLNILNETSKALIIISMILGGCTDSTAGGIKTLRTIMMFKALKWELKLALSPKGTRIIRKIGDREVTDEVLIRTALFMLIYVLLVFIGGVAISIEGYSLVDSMFEAASAIGNVGLTMNITSHLAPTWIKLILMIYMLLGRLEILPYLLLIYRFIKK